MENIKSPSNVNEEEMYYEWYENQERKKEKEIEQMREAAEQEWPDE